jgi:hypothetical protein
MGVAVFFTGSDADKKLADSLRPLFVDRLGLRYDVVPVEEATDYLGKSEVLPVLACFVGVDKVALRRVLDRWWIPWLFFGPSYVARGVPGRYRAAVGDVHPLHWLNARFSFDGVPPNSFNWQSSRALGACVLVCGASDAFHDFMGLPSPEVWLRSVIKSIRRWSRRSIVFRPKPGHGFHLDDWYRLEGVHMTKNEGLLADMREANCMVVDSSNACLDALGHGLPCVVLGSGVTKSISVEMPLIETLPAMPEGAHDRFMQQLTACDLVVSEDGVLLSGAPFIDDLLGTHPRTRFLLAS